jgi:heme/copper-type cytochrome/quinol oxidase subunit 1
MGMAPRMVPGFLGVRRLAYPRLVALSCYLAGSAMLFRVLPYLLPFAPTALPMSQTTHHVVMQCHRVANHLFGLSGLLSWLAVVVLAVNLWTTMRRETRLQI